MDNAIYGSAKAWVNFNGVTTATVRASYNVSSVTYLSSAKYQINFTNALVDANYSIIATGGQQGVLICGNTTSQVYPPYTTTSAQLVSIVSSTSALYDCAAVTVSVFR